MASAARISAASLAWALSWCGILCLIPTNRCPAAETSLADARRLLLHGNYAEAAEAYEPLTDKHPVEAALGLARCDAAVGKTDEAVAKLTQAALQHPEAAALQSELALLAFERGDYPAATEAADAAIKLDAQQLPARWVTAELHRTAGRMKEANAAYLWLVDFHKTHAQFKDPDALRWIGLAEAQYARWNRLAQQFSSLVNDLYPRALELDPDYWPAHYEAGLLFLEKYNASEAAKEFKQALAINPSAAEVQVALANLALQTYDLPAAKVAIDRALEINPQLVLAWQAKADLHLSNFEYAEATTALERALKLNPQSAETLGRLAATRGAREGLRDDLAGTQLGKLIDETVAHNPHAGDFFVAVADTFDRLRRYPAAALYYRRAIEVMPELAEARGQLGLVYMRLGQEVEAEKILKEAFDIDPFNVRVNNTLEVLEVLDSYAVLETEHFVIKFDRGRDELLAKYAAQFLEEEVYPDLCQKLAYKPQGKSLFEIFSRAKHTDGHGWFSARMVGLPNIGTVGACAGKMVALTSPTDAAQKFNWSRVLKHEFVHVVNLQQTNFNIPHWFTEALAVHNEGYPPPPAWDTLLAERLTSDTLFNLDNLNLAFVRPKTPQDWQLAYCQSELYVQYMLAHYGDDATAKMLTAYADNLDTTAALRRSFDVSQADFEHAYLEFLKQRVAGRKSGEQKPTLSAAELAKAAEKQLDNADLDAQTALAYLNDKDFSQARAWVRRALDHQPRHQLATYVLARLRIRSGENQEALELLEGALDRKTPQPNLLSLLAALKFKSEDYAAAAELYDLGAAAEPDNVQWTQLQARVYLKLGDDAKLTPILTRLANIDADDALVRKKLALITLNAQDFSAAAKWARQCLYIDVADIDAHRALAAALAGGKKFSQAAAEYEVLVELLPRQLALRLSLAQAYADASEPAKARAAVQALLALDPKFPGAAELLETLKP